MNPQIYNLTGPPIRKANNFFLKTVILLLIVALIMCLAFYIYNSIVNGNGPEVVVEKMVKSINSGNFTDFIECLTPHEQAAYKSQLGITGLLLDIGTNLLDLPGIPLDGYTDLMGGLFASSMGDQYVNYYILDTEYSSNHDTAELTVRFFFPDGSWDETNQLSFIKISGEWYLDENIIEANALDF